MKIVDLANSLAPGARQNFNGIRQDEKLHEVMVPIDDGRMTLEQDVRFVIQPDFKWWSKEEFTIKGAKPVKKGFAYSSDNNNEWLAADSLSQLLEFSSDEFPS